MKRETNAETPSRTTWAPHLYSVQREDCFCCRRTFANARAARVGPATDVARAANDGANPAEAGNRRDIQVASRYRAPAARHNQPAESRRKLSAFTLIEILVVLAIISILAALAYPSLVSAINRAQFTTALNSARQLQIATQSMSLDSARMGRGISWTFANDTPLTVAEFTAALVNDKYLSAQDMRKLLGAPGLDAGAGPWNAEGIAWRIYSVKESAPGTALFLVSRNWQDGALLPDEPFGEKGCVWFRKGGEGNYSTRPSDYTIEAITDNTPLTEPLQ